MASVFIFFLLLRVLVLRFDTLSSSITRTLFAVSLTYLFVYVFGLLDLVSIGPALIWTSLFLSVLTFAFINRNSILPPQKWDLIFCGILVILYFFAQGVVVHLGDEYEVWGAVVKHLVLFHELPKNADNFQFASFLHGQGLWIHFLTFSSPLNESSWYFAKVTTLLFFLFIGALALRDCQKCKAGPVLSFLFLVGAGFFTLCLKDTDHLYLWSLMADVFLGVLFFVSIAAGLTEHRALSLVLLFTSILILTTLKSLGFVFALWGLGHWVIVKDVSTRGRLLVFFLGTALVFILHRGWNFFLDFHHVQRIYDSSLIQWSDILTRYSRFSLTDLERAILDKMVTRMSELSIDLLLALGAITVFMGISRLKGSTRGKSSIFLLTSFVAYFCLLFVHYSNILMVVFPNEAQSVNSLRRYLFTFEMAWVLIAVSFLADAISKRLSPTRRQLLVSLICLMAMGLANWKNLKRTHKLIDFRVKLDSEVSSFSQKIPLNKKIFVICQDPLACSLRYWHLTYIMMPLKSRGDMALVKKWPDSKNPDYNQLSWDDFALRMKDFNYVLVRRSDSVFWQDFGVHFSNHKTGLFEISWEGPGQITPHFTLLSEF